MMLAEKLWETWGEGLLRGQAWRAVASTLWVVQSLAAGGSARLVLLMHQALVTPGDSFCTHRTAWEFNDLG